MSLTVSRPAASITWRLPGALLAAPEATDERDDRVRVGCPGEEPDQTVLDVERRAADVVAPVHLRRRIRGAEELDRRPDAETLVGGEAEGLDRRPADRGAVRVR